MNLKTVTIADLSPHPQNPNTHPAKQIDALGDSLDEFDQVKNVVVWNRTILAGHGVIEAAIKSGRLTLEAVDVSHWPEDKATAFMLADIRTPGMAIVDEAAMVEALRAMDAPLDIPGFDEDFLKGLPGFEPEPPPEPGEPPVDKADELREKWGTELGQLWALGEHRLAVGDCTDRAVVERVMGGEKADMVFTDPPYNVSYQDNESVESLKKRNRRTDGLVVSNDSMTDDEFAKFLVSALGNAPISKGNSFYLCAPPGHPETLFRNALNNVSGWQLKQCIVWVKDQFVFGRQDYHYRHESILYGWIKGGTHYFLDDRTQDTVWEIDRPRVSEFHPTMKPLELPKRAIKNSSRNREIVFDLFLGSGTTLIACEQLNRRCRGIEISPAYAAVTLQRFLDLTSIQPELIK